MVETNFISFQILKIDRLILRKLENGDAREIFAHR